MSRIQDLEDENAKLRSQILAGANPYPRNPPGAGAINECNAQVTVGYAFKQESPEENIAYLEYLFTFHDDPNNTPHFVEIREAALQFAKVLIRHCPSSADRTFAIRKVREAVMTANAAVALNGRGL